MSQGLRFFWFRVRDKASGFAGFRVSASRCSRVQGLGLRQGFLGSLKETP